MTSSQAKQIAEQYLNWLGASTPHAVSKLEGMIEEALEGQWMPIETAPRDGTQFLVLLSNGWYDLLRCRADLDWSYQWWISSGRNSVPIVETHPDDTDWKATDTILATHWRPLPPNPKD